MDWARDKSWVMQKRHEWSKHGKRAVHLLCYSELWMNAREMAKKSTQKMLFIQLLNFRASLEFL